MYAAHADRRRGPDEQGPAEAWTAAAGVVGPLAGAALGKHIVQRNVRQRELARGDIEAALRTLAVDGAAMTVNEQRLVGRQAHGRQHLAQGNRRAGGEIDNGLPLEARGGRYRRIELSFGRHGQGLATKHGNDRAGGALRLYRERRVHGQPGQIERKGAACGGDGQAAAEVREGVTRLNCGHAAKRQRVGGVEPIDDIGDRGGAAEAEGDVAALERDRTGPQGRGRAGGQRRTDVDSNAPREGVDAAEVQPVPGVHDKTACLSAVRQRNRNAARGGQALAGAGDGQKAGNRDIVLQRLADGRATTGQGRDVGAEGLELQIVRNGRALDHGRQQCAAGAVRRRQEGLTDRDPGTEMELAGGVRHRQKPARLHRHEVGAADRRTDDVDLAGGNRIGDQVGGQGVRQPQPRPLGRIEDDRRAA